MSELASDQHDDYDYGQDRDHFLRRDWYDYDYGLDEWEEGEARMPYPKPSTCPECKGSGTVERAEVVRTRYGPRVAPYSLTYHETCPRCQGNGTVDVDETDKNE